MIPTELNVADYLTKGMSLKMFKTKFNLWVHGPEFISEREVKWPQRELHSLSAESKAIACNVAVVEKTSVIDIEKFSDVNKLFKVCFLVFSLVFSLIEKVRGVNFSTEMIKNKSRM